MKRKRISWLAATGIVSVLAGCGSSSPTPVSTGTAASSAQSAADSAALARYIERGDQVCSVSNAAIASVNARGAQLQRRHRGTPDEAALLVPVLREGLHVYRRYLWRFARIPPPPQEAAPVSAILAGLGKVGNDLERLAGALARGEVAQAKAITSQREVDHARVSAQELELGFKVCGQPAAQFSASG